MLSEAEAVSFVTDTLKITSPLEKKAENASLLLEELIRKFHGTIPWQNVSLVSQKQSLRRKPTLEEIKEKVLSSHGGLCYTLNVFMKYLLESLGYSVYHVSGTVALPDGHIVTIVTDLKVPGDKHLVDVGLGAPTLSAIPLDFEDESPIYIESFATYKFIHRDGKYVRFDKKKSAAVMWPTEGNEEWKEFFSFDLTPRELAFFDEAADKLYSGSDILANLFHSSLLIGLFSGPSLQARYIKNTVLLHENDSHELMVVKLGSNEELLMYAKEHFPVVSIKEIQGTIQNINLSFEAS